MSQLMGHKVAREAEASYALAHVGNNPDGSSRSTMMKSRRTYTANRMALRVLAAGCVLGVALTVAAPSLAQRRRISLDEIVVEGNIQKPEAFFILPRTSLNFEDLERREDLKQRIIDSVEKAPF